ncbi:MAG TPA: pyruvate ferredoxin oxidoreductase [Gammaproteobacteria bacterium]|nr:pyruvate ferredoxin oxidoreductase [Gammaproteobacteria bacterium]
MIATGQRRLLTGNQAVAWAVRLCRPQVIPVYPITPQTPILEQISAFCATGELTAELLTPESEHSAIAASISASLTGARVFTATSSQGLLLMHELLHWAAGARAAVVMCNVNRTVASPWGFWPDQTDSLAQRDTGWIQIYTESAQESLDAVIMAFRLAEGVNLPVMVCHDAFYVSHALETVFIPELAEVERFLPAYQPRFNIDPAAARSVGSNADQMTYRRARQDIGVAMTEAGDLTDAIAAEWSGVTGRDQHGAVEVYRCEDAEQVFVTMGSLCGTVREAVDSLREQGHKTGLLKIRQFRPFPGERLRGMLRDRERVMVLDRNYSPGNGGILYQEVRAVLYGMHGQPMVLGYLTGVGGVNVAPEDIVRIALEASRVGQDNAYTSVWS